MNKPYLIWAGNKEKQAQAILEILPPGRKLIEPFAGSCAVGLASAYEKVLAN